MSIRIAIDTNVLVRYLVWDDEAQAQAAAHAIEGAGTVLISTIVLCETVWVLKRTYKYQLAEIASVMQRLIRTAAVELDRPAAEAGLAHLQCGGDFADGVILLEAERAKCVHLVTLDRNFTKTAKSPLLRLMAA